MRPGLKKCYEGREGYREGTEPKKEERSEPLQVEKT